MINMFIMIKMCTMLKYFHDKQCYHYNKFLYTKHIIIDKKNLIHAYGPKKKVIIMNTEKTISKILKDTNLKPIFLKKFQKNG